MLLSGRASYGGGFRSNILLVRFGKDITEHNESNFIRMSNVSAECYHLFSAPQMIPKVDYQCGTKTGHISKFRWN